MRMPGKQILKKSPQLVTFVLNSPLKLAINDLFQYTY